MALAIAPRPPAPAPRPSAGLRVARPIKAGTCREGAREEWLPGVDLPGGIDGAAALRNVL